MPEESDNLNLGGALRAAASGPLRVSASAHGFLRSTDNEIVLLSNGAVFQHQNVLSARTTGVQAEHKGERIPHRPHVFASGAASLRLRDLFTPDDLLALGGDVRYVKSFYLGWQSKGDPSFKLTVPDQLVTGVFVTYAAGQEPRITSTYEVQNLTDARVYDFYGVQRPGRSYHVKLSVDL